MRDKMLTVLVLLIFIAIPFFGQAQAEQEVIPDSSLANFIRTELNIDADDPITVSDLQKLPNNLDLRNLGIQSLQGLQNATHITSLDLRDNKIQNISPLIHLKGLKEVKLSGNLLDLSPDSQASKDIRKLEQANVQIDVAPVSGIDTLSLDKAAIELEVGENSQLNVGIEPKDAKTELVWESSHPEFATVDSYGLVTAIGQGTATITLKDIISGKETTCQVTVIAPGDSDDNGDDETTPDESQPDQEPQQTEPDPVDQEPEEELQEEEEQLAITNITLGFSRLVLNIGDEYTLTAEINPENASGVNLTWTSDNPDVAEIRQDGTILAISPGEVIISVTNDNGVSASVIIEVVEASHDLKYTHFFLSPNDTVQLVNMLQAVTDWKDITWTADFEVVDFEMGIVTALAPGSTLLTVEADDVLIQAVIYVITEEMDEKALTLNDKGILYFSQDALAKINQFDISMDGMGFKMSPALWLSSINHDINDISLVVEQFTPSITRNFIAISKGLSIEGYVNGSKTNLPASITLNFNEEDYQEFSIYKYNLDSYQWEELPSLILGNNISAEISTLGSFVVLTPIESSFSPWLLTLMLFAGTGIGLIIFMVKKR